jgi:hypothetical protein
VVARSTVLTLCLAGSLASLAALPLGNPLGAQEKSTKETKAANTVPQSAQPPAGLCRVWLENVPASQQPAPTDCATAIKNRPQNARIVFGNLRDEAAKPPQKSNAAPSQSRISGWPNRQGDSPRRFDTSPGIPSRTSETRASDGGVRPVGATTPVVTQPSSDSGPKRRP